MVRLGREIRIDDRKRINLGKTPWLGPVGQVPVGQKKDRCSVRDGNAGCLDGGVEAVGGALRGDDGNGRFSVAPEHRLQEIRLLGLCRQSRRWSAALNIHDDEREFEGHG